MEYLQFYRAIFKKQFAFCRSSSAIPDATRRSGRGGLQFGHGSEIRSRCIRRQFRLSSLHLLSHIRAIYGPLWSSQFLSVHHGVCLRARTPTGLRTTWVSEGVILNNIIFNMTLCHLLACLIIMAKLHKVALPREKKL